MYRQETTMRNEQAAPETKGVTVKLLATVDLGPEMVSCYFSLFVMTSPPNGSRERFGGRNSR
jgi:hypothetical protein